MTVIVFAGETEEQALARSMRWSEERKALLGYRAGTFVVKGRRCVEQPSREPVQYLQSGDSVSEANNRFQRQLQAERDQLIAARARREARTPSEFISLLRQYGGGGG